MSCGCAVAAAGAPSMGFRVERAYREGIEVHAPNPRAHPRRSSAEVARAVRAGRALGEGLRALQVRAHEPDADDRALATELARVLLRRAESHHEGWRHLRQALQEAGAQPPWSRCERQAIAPTRERVLRDCATPGRTPLVRVQHAAAQELARALIQHIDAAAVLPRLMKDPPAAVSDAAWERALVGAVAARTRNRARELIAAAVTADPHQ